VTRDMTQVKAEYTTCAKCGKTHPAETACVLCGRDKPKRKKATRRRSDRTPRSKIRSALRQLTLRCRERGVAMKSNGYKCAVCGAKQSKAMGREVKIECHHIDPIAEGNWMNKIIDLIQEHLLVEPSRWKPLCETCHELEHAVVPDDAEPTAIMVPDVPKRVFRHYGYINGMTHEEHVAFVSERFRHNVEHHACPHEHIVKCEETPLHTFFECSCGFGYKVDHSG